jgi:RNA polymerase sigma-70 factor, ECF subfamily
VARLRAGDLKAESALLARFARPVRLLLDRHTSGRPEAEDLFQDVFRLALEKLRRGELREPDKLPGFLAQIARSLAIEHYRKLGRRKTDTDSDALLAAPATGEGPLAELLDRENAALVRTVLGELGTPRDREVLLRVYLTEDDKDRIAADHGLTSLQLNRVLHRARQRYKELFLERQAAADRREGTTRDRGGR